MDDAIAVPARRSESISGYMRVAGYLAERDSIRRLDRLGIGIRKKMPAIRKTPAIRWRRRPAPNEIGYILCHARPRLVPPHQYTEYRRAARPAAWVAQRNLR